VLKLKVFLRCCVFFYNFPVIDNKLLFYWKVTFWVLNNCHVYIILNPKDVSACCIKIIFYLYYEKKRADPVAARSETRALSARTLDRGFESLLRHGCLSSSVYVVLSCVGRGLATS
jgi:hypothetical protein